MAEEQARQMGEQVRQVGGQAKEEAQGVWQRVKKHSPGPVGWVALAGTLLVGMGMGVVLLLLSPVLLFLSPVLIPLGIVLSLATAVVVGTGGSAAAALSAAVWLYRYLKGRHPWGSRNVDRILGRAHHTAQHLQHKAHDVATHVPLPTLA